MIFPRFKYFAVGNGRSDEPIRAYFLTYFVAVSFTAIGKTIFSIIFLIKNLIQKVN
jgi:hypothetical protein